jgi:hypothetical protein
MIALKLFKHGRSAADTYDLIPLLGQEVGQHGNNRLIVVGDQNSPVCFFV